jgi:LysM repeat protein
MKTANPFIPAVSLMIVPQRDRRERFKLAIFSVLTAHLVFLVFLLVQGYRTDTTLITGVAAEPSDSPPPTAAPAAPVESKPAAGLAPSPAPAAAPRLTAPHAQPLPETISPPAPSLKEYAGGNPSDTLHVVKSGDTLSAIARIHGTSVRALKAANHLNSERLTVGTRLKVPDAKLLAVSTPAMAAP